MTRLANVGPWLDRNVKVWIAALTIIVLGLLVAVAVIALQAADTAAATAKQQAIREGTIKADFQACLKSIPITDAISRHVRGVNDFDDAVEGMATALAGLADTLSQNSAASIEARPPGDPLLPTARANLRRLIDAEASVAVARQKMAVARQKVAAVKSLPVPTLSECAARRVAAELTGG